MSEPPRIDPSNKDDPRQDAIVPGGINIHDGHVDVGGDMVGRDKITNNTWNIVRQFVMQPWAWIGGVVVLVIGLVLSAVIFNVTPLVALLPTPTPAATPIAFLPAKAGESLIIVANFEDRSGGKYQVIDPAQYIHEQLTAQAKKDNLSVRVERLRLLVDDNTVKQIGATYDATMVLWGWYDALSITPRLERIKSRPEYQSTEGGRQLTLADPTKVEFTIVTDLPARSAYLVFFSLGLDAYSAGDSDAGLDYFNSAINSIPKDVVVTNQPTEAYLYRGNIYYNRGDYDRAIADYDQVLKLKPDNASTYYNRGVAYYSKGEYDRAIADYDQHLKLKPDNADAYFSRGIAYYDRGEYDRAIADYDQHLKLKPDNADAYFSRGIAYYDRGDYDRAIADYDQHLKLKPDNADAYFSRGIAYYDRGDYDRAIADYDQHLKLKPDNADAYFSRGIAYYDQNDHDRAIADFRKVLELSKDARLRQEAQEQLRALGVQ